MNTGFLALHYNLNQAAPVQCVHQRLGEEKALNSQFFPVLLGPLRTGTEIPVPTPTGWTCLFSLSLGSIYSLFSFLKNLGRGRGPKGEDIKNKRKRHPGQFPRGVAFPDSAVFSFNSSHFLHFKSSIILKVDLSC